MLRIHFLQQWFGLADVAMEEALYDVPFVPGFASFSTHPLRFDDSARRHEF